MVNELVKMHENAIELTCVSDVKKNTFFIPFRKIEMVSLFRYGACDMDLTPEEKSKCTYLVFIHTSREFEIRFKQDEELAKKIYNELLSKC
jgi:hypothetical protein